MLGGKTNRVAKTERPRIINAEIGGAALGLVAQQNDRFTGAAHELREIGIGRRHPHLRVDHEEDAIGQLYRHLGLGAHAAGERFNIALFKACGVNDREIQIGNFRRAFATIARNAGLVIDQRKFFADEPVEKRRLAYIRTADDGDGERHGVQIRCRRTAA